MKESNKLIAEFMELPTEVFKPSGIINYYHKEYNSGTWYEAHELSYNVSWDWLMPVVQKIGDEYLNTPFDETYSHLTEQYENIWTLEDTYNAVVEFIKDQNTEVIGSFDENGDLI